MFAATELLRADENLMFLATRWTLPKIFEAGLKLDPARLAEFMGWARQRYQHRLSNIPTDWDGHKLDTSG